MYVLTVILTLCYITYYFLRAMKKKKYKYLDYRQILMFDWISFVFMKQETQMERITGFSNYI